VRRVEDFRAICGDRGGDRLRIRPADRVTPALRDQIVRHKSELLAALAPVTEFVSLKGGLVVPLPALLLALDLEACGFRMNLDADDQFVIAPMKALTEVDRAGIRRWYRYLGALVRYEAPRMEVM
jgi:hypothetical protein